MSYTHAQSFLPQPMNVHNSMYTSFPMNPQPMSVTRPPTIYPSFPMNPQPMSVTRPPTIYANPAPVLLSHNSSLQSTHSHKSQGDLVLELATYKATKEAEEATKEAAKLKKWKKEYNKVKYGNSHNTNTNLSYLDQYQEGVHNSHQNNQSSTVTPTLIAPAATAATTATSTDAKWKDKNKDSILCKKGFLGKSLKKSWKRVLIYVLIFLCMVAHIAILRQSLEKINLSQNQEDIKNKIIGVFVAAVMIFILILGVFLYCFRWITLFFLVLTLGLVVTAITNIIFLIQLEYN